MNETQATLEDRALARGMRQGFERAKPFHGVSGLLSFPTVDPAHEAVIVYEKALLQGLVGGYRQIHHAETEYARAKERVQSLVRQEFEIAEDIARGTSRVPVLRQLRNSRLRRLHEMEKRAVDAYLDRAEWRLNDAKETLDNAYMELQNVRQWLDAFVNTARSYADERPSLRRDPGPKPQPNSIIAYASIQDFVEEQPARALPDWPRREDATGADFGYDWTWQDYDRPWIVTKWRLSYIEELNEVYARKLTNEYESSGWSEHQVETVHPVWLLHARFVIPGRGSLPGFRTEWDRLSELQAELMGERNSLILLAETLNAEPVASSIS